MAKPQESDKSLVMAIVAQKKAKKTRKIVLKEDVVDLEKKGQLLDDKAGFYRNYLFPMGKAQIVTPVLLKRRSLSSLAKVASKALGDEKAKQQGGDHQLYNSSES
ncbi:hypothetical protein LOK49_LG11G01363 [Camellia lanceoleosa]|uniref:Uncharacterized protein n=1 Tax=Camellia lanceoleosa TaxID=1840588 RepID=A0ACC0FYU7_9ERIC|nr:hypothetical protein LOK49_LG11G01363 [Camellia lanceoleosa]